MIAALLQHDATADRRWLSFPRPPPRATRASLVLAGWRYHGGHRAWHHDNAAAEIPPGFVVARGGTCNYSAVRAVRGVAILELLGDVRARLAAAAQRPGSAPFALRTADLGGGA